MLRKLLLVRLCNVVWAFFSVFSIFCITSFGDCNRPQHQENTGISDPVLVRSILQAEPRADLGGGCRGCAPPRDDLRFSNTTGILQKKTMWFIGVEVEQETSAPPSKKNLGSAPVIVLL